jgi:hypothetical protein
MKLVLALTLASLVGLAGAAAALPISVPVPLPGPVVVGPVGCSVTGASVALGDEIAVTPPTVDCTLPV